MISMHDQVHKSVDSVFANGADGGISCPVKVMVTLGGGGGRPGPPDNTAGAATEEEEGVPPGLAPMVGFFAVTGGLLLFRRLERGAGTGRGRL